MSLFKDTLEHLNAYFAKEGMAIEAIEKVEPKTPAALLAFTADRENEENKLEKFEDITLADGVTVITVEPAIEIGAAIVVVTEEGIIPALEPAHAIAHLSKIAPKMGKEKIVILCLSGRGDKDVEVAAKALRVG